MREIKFRAWDKSDKKLKYSDDYSGLGLFFGLKEHREEYGVKYELMQFTGLKDKNSKEIYEGDIVRVEVPFEDCSDFYTVSVSYKLEKAEFVFQHPIGTQFKMQPENLEVIGNIYENPELLEAK